jgi:hypothetical protein
VGQGVERLDHATMAVALAEGDASHLSQTINKFAHYQDKWWANSPLGWVRLTDQQVCESLDKAAAQLAAADNAVERLVVRAHRVAQPAGES